MTSRFYQTSFINKNKLNAFICLQFILGELSIIIYKSAMIRGLKITFPDIENTVEYLFEILIQNEKWLFSSTGRYDVGLHLH